MYKITNSKTRPNLHYTVTVMPGTKYKRCKKSNVSNMKLRVFENMVLRRIFGLRRDEVTGEWRRLHNEELNDLYSSPNIVRVIKSRRMRWAGHVARKDEEREVYRVLVGKPEGRRPLGRPRRRWLDNIRMDFQEVGCGFMEWIGLTQDRDRWRTLVSAVMNLRVP